MFAKGLILSLLMAVKMTGAAENLEQSSQQPPQLAPQKQSGWGPHQKTNPFLRGEVVGPEDFMAGEWTQREIERIHAMPVSKDSVVSNN